MAGKKSDLGPIGVGVTHNLRRLREGRNLSYAELARRVTAAGRPIAPLGLRRIEAGTRKVDPDDLVALALVLDVSPVTLLMPDTADETEQVTLTETRKCDAGRLWAWLGGGTSIEPGVNSIEYQLSGVLPSWLKAQLLANIRDVTARFDGEGTVSTKSESENG